jgi:hypothetical protein
LIRAVVIQPFIHFWTNCETAQNLFKNRLIQGLMQRPSFRSFPAYVYSDF